MLFWEGMITNISMWLIKTINITNIDRYRLNKMLLYIAFFYELIGFPPLCVPMDKYEAYFYSFISSSFSFLQV